MVEYKIQHTHNESFREKKEKNGGPQYFSVIPDFIILHYLSLHPPVRSWLNYLHLSY